MAAVTVQIDRADLLPLLEHTNGGGELGTNQAIQGLLKLLIGATGAPAPAPTNYPNR